MATFNGSSIVKRIKCVYKIDTHFIGVDLQMINHHFAASAMSDLEIRHIVYRISSAIVDLKWRRLNKSEAQSVEN